MAIILLVEVAFSVNKFDALIYCVLIIIAVFFIVVLLLGPYFNTFANVCLLIGDTTAIYSFIMAVVQRFASVS